MKYITCPLASNPVDSEDILLRLSQYEGYSVDVPPRWVRCLATRVLEQNREIKKLKKELQEVISDSN